MDISLDSTALPLPPADLLPRWCSLEGKRQLPQVVPKISCRLCWLLEVAFPPFLHALTDSDILKGAAILNAHPATVSASPR